MDDAHSGGWAVQKCEGQPPLYHNAGAPAAHQFITIGNHYG